MFGKKKAADARIPGDVVTLKPLFGIRPGVYLTVLYSAALLTVIFFVLIYPGLNNPGSLVTLNSEPWGAAVRVDDVYVGTTPSEVFIPAGSRKFTAVLPGFTETTVDHSVGGRVFASLFFPKREILFFSPERKSSTAPLLEGAVSYARWSFAGEAGTVYQIPRDLSEGAYRAGMVSEFRPEGHAEILRASARFAASGSALRDLLRAQFLTDSAGLSPSPSAALRSIRTALSYLAEAQGSPAWLASVLPADAISILAESSWYLRTMDEAAVMAAAPGPIVTSGRLITVEGIRFREIPGGNVVVRGTFPRTESVSSFFIADREMDTETFARFLAERSNWASSQREFLIREGLVGEAYLETPSFSAYPRGVESGISWYAAQAYTEWLTEKLPASLSGYEVRLPTETEWEYAANRAEYHLLSGMVGSLWEWCADPYVPLDFLPSPGTGIEAQLSPERSVRGGSWINTATTVGAEIRGSLPPGSSSPFVGFRPVLAPMGRNK